MLAGPAPAGTKLASVVNTSLSNTIPDSRIHTLTVCTPAPGTSSLRTTRLLSSDHNKVPVGKKRLIFAALLTWAPSKPTCSESELVFGPNPRTHT